MPQTGESLRDQGIARAINGDELWHDRIRLVIRTLAAAGVPFTVEAVREAAGLAGAGNPKHHNSWGAAMRSAACGEIIVPTGQYVKARRPSRHAGILAVYRGGPLA